MSHDRPRSTLTRLRVPFWNNDRRRLRALWRVVGALVAVLGLTSLLAARVPDGPLIVQSLVTQAVYVAVTLFVLVVWSRYVDRRPVRDYGLAVDGQWLRWASVGCLLAVGAFGGALATDVAVGWASVETVLAAGRTFPVWLGLLAGASNFLMVAVWEEVLFRGLLLRNAVVGLRVGSIPDWGAAAGGLAAVSAVFALGHASQAGSIVALSFWFGMGVLLGGAYLLTDSLAVPIGLHFGADLAFNTLFGLSNVRPVGDAFAAVVRPTFSGPVRFVDVAGYVNTVWIVILGIVLLAVLRLRGPLSTAVFEE
jgi:membrane protease YdiL (CAAX protease family)